ncbi:MAG: hypothetical protein HRU12_23785 [Phaeodactylibacter sp.]|nr:hypothetical protein [Phaeodactylibacter sp.]
MTLRILKGALNNLTVTLSELADENLPSNWLWRFINDQNQVEHLAFLSDVGLYPERSNKCQLTEGIDITFETLGNHKYIVYQMPDTDDTDYTRGVEVEIGKAVVFEAAAERIEHEPSNSKAVYER